MYPRAYFDFAQYDPAYAGPTHCHSERSEESHKQIKLKIKTGSNSIRKINNYAPPQN